MERCFWRLLIIVFCFLFIPFANGYLKFSPKPHDFHNSSRPPMTGGIKDVDFKIENADNPSLGAVMYDDQSTNLNISVKLLPNTTDSIYVEIIFPHGVSQEPLCLPIGINKTIVCNGTKTVYQPYFQVTNTSTLKSFVKVTFDGPVVPQLIFVAADLSESNSSDVTCETTEQCLNPAFCDKTCTNLGNVSCIPTHCINLENKTCVGPNCLNWTDNLCPVHEACRLNALANATCIPTHCGNLINATCVGKKCLNWTKDQCVKSETPGCSKYDLKEATCIPKHCIDLVNATCVGKNCLNWTENSCAVHKSCAASNLDNASCIPAYCENYKNASCVGSKCLNWTENVCEIPNNCSIAALSTGKCIPAHCSNLINKTCVGPLCLNWTNDTCPVPDSCFQINLDSATCIPAHCRRYINSTKNINLTNKTCPVHESCFPANFDNTSCIPDYCVNYQDAVCVGKKCLNWTTDQCKIEKPCLCEQNVTTCKRRVKRSLQESFSVSTMMPGKPAILLKFDRIAVNSSDTGARIDINFPVDPSYVYVGGNYVFEVNAGSTWLDGKSEQETVHITGVDLDADCRTMSDVTELEAGNQMWFDMEVKHSGLSEKDAAPVKLQISTTYATFKAGNITYGNPLQTYELNAANLSQIMIGGLSKNKKIVMHMLVYVPDDARPIGGNNVYLSVKYKPADRPDYQEQQTRKGRSYSLRQPTVSTGQSEINVPRPWSRGQIVSQTVKFKIPLGTTRSIEMQTIVTGNSATAKKIQWISSSVSAPSYIVFANPGLVNTLQRVESSRRKRATSQTVSMKRIVGNVVNPALTGSSNTTISITNQYVLDPSASVVPGDSFQIAQSSLTLNGMTASLLSNNQTTYTGSPDLVITKTRKIWNSSPLPQTTRFTVTVKHTNYSTAPAYDVYITDLIPYHEIDYSSLMTPIQAITPGFSYNQVNSAFLWKTQQLDLNETLVLTYEAVPTNDGEDLPENTTNFLTSLVYYSADTDNQAPGYAPQKYGPDIVGVCLSKQQQTKSNVVLDHGFTVLSFFIAAIVAVLLVLLIMFLYVRYTEGSLMNSVNPASQADLRRGNLILDGGENAKKKGWNTVKDFETISVDESIVCILSSNDKVTQQREIDRLDILNTIKVDGDIENERNSATVDTSVGLVKCLRHNNDITEKVEKGTVETLRVNIKNVEKRLEIEFKKMLQEVFLGLSYKNKSKLQSLTDKQLKERQELKKQTDGMPAKEKSDLIKLQHQQHTAEQDELTYLLKLEQDEEQEKLRKEFAIKKRMQLQQVQREFLEGVVTKGDLSQEQADWLMKEHRNNQSRVEKIYDDEISRQRMILEEKLARRKQLAAANESQEDDESELLNTLAGHQIQTVTKMKKQGTLDQEEADVYMEQIKQEMMETKKRHDQEKTRQANELHKKLSERKKARLLAKHKEQAQELEELAKKQQAQQTEQAVDPVSLLEAKMCVVSQHRNELSQLENEIDKEHATELENLIEDLTVKTKAEIEQSGLKLIEKLKREGADEAALNKIVKQHEKDVEQLRGEHEQNRQSQEDKFKKQLAKRKRELAQRREDEKVEQAKLREHDSNVVKNLIDNQVAMSEDERDRIMKEHEQQMVKLENSLTLNKLQQQRMLGEKLAAKKKQQLEKLQKKQVTEIKKQEKSQARNVDDEDEEEQHIATLELLKQQAQQRLDILHGETVDYTQELEAVKEEMIKERAISLKDQEDRLGAMMANLQMEKAREMAKIEEQQKAIIDLKANLMEDLNDRGVLSDPQCKKVIDRHHEETEKLNEKLDSQRAKQEQALRRKLEQKLEAREDTIIRMHKSQLKTLLENPANKTAVKLRQMALMHKQKQEIEQFKERVSKQISQNVQELRRQQELKKRKVLQEKELQFIAGLVRLGHLKREELINVLSLLFPGRSNDDLEAILQKIYDGQNGEEEESDENDMLNASSASMLEARVKSARLGRVKTMDTIPDIPKRKKKRRSLKKGYSRDEDAFDPESSIRYRSLDERPEPLGADYDEPSYESGDRARRKLPPLKPKGKKKKKPVP